MKEMDIVIEEFRQFFESDPDRIFWPQDLARLFDIEFSKHIIRHGTKMTTGVWKSEDYGRLKSEFISRIKEAYNPKMK